MARLVLREGVTPKQLGALLVQAGSRKGDAAGTEQQIIDSFDLSAPGFDGVELKLVYDDLHGDQKVVHVVVPDLVDEDLEEVANEALGTVCIMGCAG
jgi:hypothetical protein